MADPRLLTAALALGALVATSCWTPRTRVLHTPVVAGRVIDHETHEPVVGAEVFVYRYALTEAFPHNVPSVFAVRTSDPSDPSAIWCRRKRDQDHRRLPHRVGGRS